MMQIKETPFMRFWRAVNEQCRANGFPEPTFGPAHRAWEAAVQQAQREAFSAAWQAAWKEVA